MQEITSKLHKKVVDEFYPVAEQLAKEGKSSSEIADIFFKHTKLKSKNYYKKPKALIPVGEIVGDGKEFVKNNHPDSIAESIFYRMLQDKEIEFKFQYPIGFYRADFLFSGSIVLEIDGVQHDKNHDDKRDKYMRSMGYKIIRVPIWILVSYPDDVVNEIIEEMEEIKPKRKKK
jgi:very-short-patch-repair endonuclease